MGQDPGTGSAAVSESQDPEQIQREIQQTREELGDTVEALAHKADVKAQARQTLEGAKSTLFEKKDQLVGKAKEASPEGAASAVTTASQRARENPLPVAAAGAFVFGFLAGRLTKH